MERRSLWCTNREKRAESGILHSANHIGRDSEDLGKDRTALRAHQAGIAVSAYLLATSNGGSMGKSAGMWWEEGRKGRRGEERRGEERRGDERRCRLEAGGWLL